jgi:signal transduction histidine kinase
LLFERFKRASNVQGRISGTGLGLWSARCVVEQHGGSIQVRSQEGRGTTVTVRLPLQREPSVGPAP